MGEAHERGKLGERAAAAYFEERGWEVLDRNWRSGSLELDLVVRSEGVLAFVEVKARGAGSAGHPLESIGPRKRRDVMRAAAAWLAAHRGRHPVEADVRFDAVSVVLGGRVAPRVEHVPDAWRVSRRG